MGPGQLCPLLFVLWQQGLKSLFELAAGPSSGASCMMTSELLCTALERVFGQREREFSLIKVMVVLGEPFSV